MLDPHVANLIEQCFSPADRAAAVEMLDTWEVFWPREAIRCQIAALKLAEGSLAQLANAIRLGEWDLRDLLAAAGLADDTLAHLHWRPTRK